MLYNEEGKELITIEKEVYNRLVKDSAMFGCLVAAGVDNWEGYPYAMDIYDFHNVGDEV